MSEPISEDKLQKRRKQLRRRKHSFVELIMQTKKNLFKEKLKQQREDEADSADEAEESQRGEAASCE